MAIRFAILGCGHIAHRHARHIVDHPEADLVLCYDIDGDSSEAFGDEFNCDVAGSLRDFVQGDFDIAVVATPNGLHTEHALAVLSENKHVLVEKPMATTTQDAERMVRQAESSGKNLFVVKQNRFNPPVQAVKDIIDRGELGKLYSVTINCFWNRNERYYESSKWKGTSDLDGGTLFNQFSHFVDVMYYLFGDIKDIQGYMANHGHQGLIDFEDSGSFNFKLADDALGSLQYSTCAFGRNVEGSITILAEHGTVKIGGKYLNTIDYLESDRWKMPHLPVSAPANNYGFYEGSMSNHDQVIANVVNALKHNEPIMTSGDEGRDVVRIIEEFYKAAGWRS